MSVTNGRGPSPTLAIALRRFAARKNDSESRPVTSPRAPFGAGSCGARCPARCSTNAEAAIVRTAKTSRISVSGGPFRGSSSGTGEVTDTPPPSTGPSRASSGGGRLERRTPRQCDQRAEGGGSYRHDHRGAPAARLHDGARGRRAERHAAHQRG